MNPVGAQNIWSCGPNRSVMGAGIGARFDWVWGCGLSGGAHGNGDRGAGHKHSGCQYQFCSYHGSLSHKTGSLLYSGMNAMAGKRLADEDFLNPL